MRADESEANKAYRDQIRAWDFYRLHQKWDLFVPFVYRSLQFLAPNGRLGLITSNAIETEGYAVSLRADLEQYWLEQVDFFPKIKLFQDAAVHNTIFILHRQSSLNPQVSRRIHQDNSFTNFDDNPLPQSAGAEVVFRHAYAPPPPGIDECTLPLCAIVYLGTGLEAHSHEKFDQTVDGQRRKLFDLSESFRESLDDLPPDQKAHFTDYGVLGSDVKDYHLSQRRHVAYDYMKDQMRRRRVPELFRTPQKVLLGETSGGYFDTHRLFANHSVQVVVPWHALSGVTEPGIKTVRRNSEATSGYNNLSAVSSLFDLRYILAVINSDFMRHYLLANQARGTRAGRIYPDVWKEIPVKVIAPQAQAELGALVEQIQALYAALAGLPDDVAVFRAWQKDHTTPMFFNDYVISGQIKLLGALAETNKSRYKPNGNKVILHKNAGLEARTGAEPLIDYFCWYCNNIEPHLRGRPWADLREQVPAPGSLEIANLLAVRDAARDEIAARKKEIEAKKDEIEAAVVAAYTDGCDDALWAQVQTHQAQTAGQISMLMDGEDSE